MINTNVLSRLNDFMTCSACFNIQSEGSISQLWNTEEDKHKKIKYVHEHNLKFSM